MNTRESRELSRRLAAMGKRLDGTKWRDELGDVWTCFGIGEGFETSPLVDLRRTTKRHHLAEDLNVHEFMMVPLAVFEERFKRHTEKP